MGGFWKDFGKVLKGLAFWNVLEGFLKIWADFELILDDGFGRIFEGFWYGADRIWESGRILAIFWVMAFGRILLLDTGRILKRISDDVKRTWNDLGSILEGI